MHLQHTGDAAAGCSYPAIYSFVRCKCWTGHACDTVSKSPYNHTKYINGLVFSFLQPGCTQAPTRTALTNPLHVGFREAEKNEKSKWYACI